MVQELKVCVLLSRSETWQTRASRGELLAVGWMVHLSYKSLNARRALRILTTSLLPVRDLTQKCWVVPFLNSGKRSISLHWLSLQVFQILDNWLMSLKLQKNLVSLHLSSSCWENIPFGAQAPAALTRSSHGRIWFWGYRYVRLISPFVAHNMPQNTTWRNFILFKSLLWSFYSSSSVLLA